MAVKFKIDRDENGRLMGEKGQAFEPDRPVGRGRTASLMLGRADFATDDRGQAFEPYKMLIGAVMALAVLLIIIGAISYFENLRIDASKQRFLEGVTNAVRQPNGGLLAVYDLQFPQGLAFSSEGVGKNVGIEGECIEFIDSGAESIEIDGKSAEFKQNQLVDAFIKCGPGVATCQVQCKISFDDPDI